MNSIDYLKINGLSNLYQGWGYENNDIYRRIELHKLRRNMDYFYERYTKDGFYELDDDAPSKITQPQKLINKQIFESNIDSENDGLGKLNNMNEYVIVKQREMYKHVKVKVQNIYDKIVK